MDQIKLQYFEDLLWKRYSELKAVEERLLGEGGLGEPAADAVGELSSYDQHPGDLGSELYERSKDLGLLETTSSQLNQIEAALAAIENGTYGVCRRCGQEIPEQRLEAIPETDLCISCRQDEEVADRSDRPIEEDTLERSLGRSFEEESWLAVESYGTASDTPEGE